MLNESSIVYIADLREYLLTQPGLAWVLGFLLVPSDRFAWRFDLPASLPTHRHLSRLLRSLPNASLQYLLDETVRLIQTKLVTQTVDFGNCVSVDIKHVIAWVNENNPNRRFHSNPFSLLL